jgi:hypothetical protein
VTDYPCVRVYPCARVRDLFLRLLGVIFFVAFLSLLAQASLLVGAEGLLPADRYLAALRRSGDVLSAPTLFWIDCSDGALRAAAIAGMVLSFGLILNLAPRLCLFALWALYLSFVTIGQDFLSFQWDNLLLESAFFALFITPGGLRPRAAPPPHPIGIFLMRWLVFRLNFESGVAKLLTGDPTWRDLTAMVAYYETAPLPTWIGWYVHQMPVWGHRLCALFTLGVELALAPLVFGPRRVRGVVCAVMTAMQLSILLTANYGFFNYLTLALGLLVLDDGHLAWMARRLRWRGASERSRQDAAVQARVDEAVLEQIGAVQARVEDAVPAETGAVPAHGRTVPARMAASAGGERTRLRSALLAAVAAILVPLSLLPFVPFVGAPRAVASALAPARRTLDVVRSINAYHLFAHMTLVRREIVIEGSADGATWLPYEFRYKPGDPERAPPVVAPHQPRVDFQLWFLTLGGRMGAPYFEALLARLFAAPAVVAPLFARDPFPETPPAFVRVAVYRYRFTDAAVRRATGAWWSRELLGYSRQLTADAFRRATH